MTTNDKTYYSRAAIIIGSFFGSILCGAYLTAHNLKNEGRQAEVRKTYITATLILVGVLALSALIDFLVPVRLPSAPFIFAQIFGFITYAETLIDKETLGQKTHFSNWRAFGISLVFLVVILAIVFGATFLLF